MTFKSFKSKFPSNCKHCRTPIEKGGDTMIAKVDKTWIVLCPKCYEDGHGAAYIPGGHSGHLSDADDLAAALAAAKASELETGGFIVQEPQKSKESSDPPKEDPKPIDYSKLPFEQRIKHLAKWILKNE